MAKKDKTDELRAKSKSAAMQGLKPKGGPPLPPTQDPVAYGPQRGHDATSRIELPPVRTIGPTRSFVER